MPKRVKIPIFFKPQYKFLLKTSTKELSRIFLISISKLKRKCKLHGSTFINLTDR